MKATKYVAMVTDNVGNESAVGYIPEKYSKEHPLGEDEGYLRGLARLEREKKESLQSSSSSNIVKDDYMTDPDEDIKDLPLMEFPDVLGQKNEDKELTPIKLSGFRKKVERTNQQCVDNNH